VFDFSLHLCFCIQCAVSDLLQYKATDYVVKEPGKLELVFTPTGGKEHRMEVFTFKDRGGVGMSMYNTDEVNYRTYNDNKSI